MDRRSFQAHLIQQGTGALNDNLFRQVFATLIIIAAASPAEGMHTAGLLGLCFMIPFLLTAPLAGGLARRYPAHHIIRAIRSAEVPLCLVGAAAMLTVQPILFMATIAGFGIQSALFAPVKYAIVPELVADHNLERANGQLAGATQMAILLGTTLAFVGDPTLLERGAFAGWQPSLTVLLIALPISALGISAAWRMPKLPAHNPQAALRPLAWGALLASLRHRPGLVIPAISSALFWAVAASIQVLLLSLGHVVFGFGLWENSLLTTGLGIAMSLGAIISDRLAVRAFPTALPVASALALGLGLLAAGSAAIHGNLGFFLVAIGAAAFCSSWWLVCMNTLLQRRSEEHRRGEVFAATSFIGNIGTAAGFGLLAVAASFFDPAPLLLLLGALVSLLAASAAWYHRLAIGGWVLCLFTRLLWRIDIRDAEQIPAGGALLACNHQSYADALVLIASLPRPVRFIADAPYLRLPVIGWVMRLGRTIAIDGDGRQHRAIRSALEQAAAAVAAGELVAIFPEGRLSVGGAIGPFRRGLERIAQASGATIVPLALHGLHGGWLAAGRRQILPRPRRPVQIAIGTPLPADTDCTGARVAVASLHAELVATTIDKPATMTLAAAFVGMVRRSPWSLAVADDRGTLSRLALGAAARACLPHLALAEEEARVGILLPPGRGGAIANLALAFAGRTSVNLNHTLGNPGLVRICTAAGLSSVITARAYTDRIGLPDLPVRWIFLEDLIPRIGLGGRLRAALGLLCLPRHLFCRGDTDDVATIVFSSGSTGAPKGAQLSHRQILANCAGVAGHFSFRPGSDRLLSPLPLFHSFGLTAGMWIGLVHGLPVIAQADPRDAANTGRLCQRHGASFMISTPTFARAYLRRVERPQFASLRFIVLGAEACPNELIDRFRDAFGVDLYEGYGCTELGPVVAVNRNDEQRAGRAEINNRPGSVGRPLPGVTVVVVDSKKPERLLPTGSDGLLVVRSPARMLGYLDDPERTAQVFLHGGYNTGDIGHVDGDGFVHITGRLARFAKIGGEMVPLDNIEAALRDRLAAHQNDDDEEVAVEVAVAAVEDAGKGERLIVLYSGQLPCPVEELLTGLAHLPPLFRPKARNWHAVDAIPALGTGKRDLGRLNELAAQVAGES